jgi:hypothetical protein
MYQHSPQEEEMKIDNDLEEKPSVNGGTPPEGAAQDKTMLYVGILLFVIGLGVITFATFQFDPVKNQVLAPRQYPYVAAIGYVSAIGGLLLALVHYIREG